MVAVTFKQSARFVTALKEASQDEIKNEHRQQVQVYVDPSKGW